MTDDDRLPPITRKKPMSPRRSFLIGAFDTETLGLDGKFLMGQVYHEYWNDAVTFPTPDDMLNHIFGLPAETLRKTIWYAHNSEYDWRYIIGGLRAFGHNIELRERAAGKFYELRIVSTTEKSPSGRPQLITRFRDSMAVFPFSLKDFTSKFAPAYAKQDIGLSRGVTFNPRNREHVAYAKNDVIGLVRAIEGFDALIYENFHVHISSTTSSTAYNAWLRFAPEDEYHDRQASTVEAFIRRCYHGGLVSLNAIVAHEYETVRTLDINSSYPANMRLGVPKGKARWTYRFRGDKPGFYQTIATVPDDAILPIVPYRSPKDQLAWQTGTFESFLSAEEINYCRSIGVQFQIIKGVYFPGGLTYCFNEFVDICEGLRAQFKGTPLETVVKLTQNTLYGRFGMRPDGRECLISWDGQPDDMHAIFDPDTGETIPFAYYKNVVRSTEYMKPEYAAQITANARILLDRGTALAGRKHVLYRDTDSIHTVGPIDQMAELIGREYGKFKREGDKSKVVYHAPKCLTYTDPHGVTQATYKGIPHALIWTPDAADPDHDRKMADRNKLISELHDGLEVTVSFHSSSSLQSYLRAGQMFYTRTRRPTNPNMVYGHTVDSDRFRPRRAEPWLGQTTHDDASRTKARGTVRVDLLHSVMS